MSYVYHIVVFIEIYCLLSLSLNLLVGYSGLLTLAHGSFFGIGAYLTSLSLVSLGAPFSVSVVLAIAGTCLIASLLSLVSRSFKGDRFVLASLGFQILVTSVLLNWVTITAGPFGISAIPRPSILGFKFTEQRDFTLFTTVIAGSVILFIIGVCRSPFGRLLRAVREDETALMMLGKPSFWIKVQAMTVSAGCAAVAGSLYASYVSFIDPTGFGVDESIMILSMVVIGGAGNIRGPIIGTILLIMLPEVLRLMKLPSAAVGNTRMLIYGLVLIILMRFRPQGVAGDYAFD